MKKVGKRFELRYGLIGRVECRHTSTPGWRSASRCWPEPIPRRPQVAERRSRADRRSVAWYPPCVSKQGRSSSPCPLHRHAALFSSGFPRGDRSAQPGWKADQACDSKVSEGAPRRGGSGPSPPPDGRARVSADASADRPTVSLSTTRPICAETWLRGRTATPDEGLTIYPGLPLTARTAARRCRGGRALDEWAALSGPGIGAGCQAILRIPSWPGGKLRAPALWRVRSLSLRACRSRRAVRLKALPEGHEAAAHRAAEGVGDRRARKALEVERIADLLRAHRAL